MKLNANKWYKNPNLLGITTQNNKHLCNIFLPNLLQICDEYDVKNGTIIVNDLLQLLDASYEVFQNIYDNICDNLSKTIPKEFLYCSDDIPIGIPSTNPTNFIKIDKNLEKILYKFPFKDTVENMKQNFNKLCDK